MSDNEIRRILIERREAAARHERLHALKEYAEGFIGMAAIIAIMFILPVICG